MARSTAIWAAALLLASLSGSGPMLTTAEAMPAPGPQETAGRPRYYFPRHIKRQIVTNSTAPPASTSSSSSLSSPSSITSDLDTRQTTTDRTSFLESLVSLFQSQSFADPSSASSDGTASSGAQPPLTTITIGDTVITVPSTQPSGTGVPNAPVQAPPPSSNNAQNPIPTVQPIDVGSTGGVPPVIVQPTSASQQQSDGNQVVPSPAPTGPTSPPAQPSVQPEVPPTENIGSTGQLPPASEIVQPNPPLSSAPADSPSPIAGPSDPVGSTGGVPPVVVQPTSGAPSTVNDAPTGEPTVTGPFIIPSSTGASPTTSAVPSNPADPAASGSSGGVPDNVVSPTGGAPTTSDAPSATLPSSGILVGITTALGTSETPAPTPTTADGAIPTSETISETSNDPSPSGAPSVAPSEPANTLSSGAGVTDPTPGPTAPVTSSPAGITPSPAPPLESLLSSVVSDLNPIPEISSIVSSIVSEIQSQLPLPTGSTAVPIESLVSSVVSSLAPIPTETPSSEPPTTTPGVFPPSSAVPTGSVSESSGLVPSGSGISSGTGVTPTPTSDASSSTGIPVSEVPPTSLPSTSDIPLPSSLPPSSLNATSGASEPPVTGPTETPTSLPLSSSSTLEIPFSAPTITSSASSQAPLASIPATATNSDSTYIVGTQIVQEPSTVPPPTATASGIPSDLPKMIQPPSGIPAQPRDAFLGQFGFKYALNYPFVAANDGGNQIFEYLPLAISDALNITRDQVIMHGLKPWDTTRTLGFITTLALFYIPADLNGTLAAQLRNPADALWHNKNQTVNDLTSLINTAIPLPAGPAVPDGQVPLSGDPGSLPSGEVAGGGPVGGDMDASRKVNPTSAGIATGAVMGAIAYGAAMFFVARRYRNKRLAHKRTSSVANANRNTYGSIPGGAAFMSGARGPGRLTPGGRDSRGSRGSSSSQGRSIRTQQISAPVMAENSLGWN